jgi:hypothetical protein
MVREIQVVYQFVFFLPFYVVCHKKQLGEFFKNWELQTDTIKITFLIFDLDQGFPTFLYLRPP